MNSTLIKVKDLLGKHRDVRGCSHARCIGTIDDQSMKMNEGNAFFYKTFADITGAATVTDFLFTAPNSSNRISAKAMIKAEDEFTLQIYEDVTTSADGTPITTFNCDRNSSNTPNLTAYAGPTVTDTGTLIWQGKVTAGDPLVVVEPRFNYKIIALAGAKYLWRITKINTGTHYVDFDFFWTEAVI